MKNHSRILSVSLVAALIFTLFFACSTGSNSGDDSLDITIRFVPGGATFTMGEHVEDTSQTVTLTKSFRMGETEVTQSLWETVWGATWPGDADGDVPSVAYGLGSNKAAYYVSWYDAVAFCNRATVKDDDIDDGEQVYYLDAALTATYTKANAAACSHTLASNARIGEYVWWWGNNGDSGTTTYGCKDVGQKTENALGIYDMTGNVYEWCHDWSGSYSAGSVSDPVGPDGGINRVARGGGWDSSSGLFLQCALRDNYTPTKRYDNIGFRLCRNAN